MNSETLTIPISISEAIRTKAPLYFTGKPCRQGHISHRRAPSGVCVECYKSWQRANLNSLASRRRERRLHDLTWAETDNKRQRDWRKKNKNKSNQWTRLKKARRRQAKPKWVDITELNLIYDQCDYITRLTGVPHEVDHIVPLQNSIVSGLHVPWNLQIIPAIENQRKSNIFQGTR